MDRAWRQRRLGGRIKVGAAAGYADDDREQREGGGSDADAPGASCEMW